MHPLPNEVFLAVLRYIPVRNFLNVSLVSRAWNEFIKEYREILMASEFSVKGSLPFHPLVKISYHMEIRPFKRTEHSTAHTFVNIKASEVFSSLFPWPRQRKGRAVGGLFDTVLHYTNTRVSEAELKMRFISQIAGKPFRFLSIVSLASPVTRGIDSIGRRVFILQVEKVGYANHRIAFHEASQGSDQWILQATQSLNLFDWDQQVENDAGYLVKDGRIADPLSFFRLFHLLRDGKWISEHFTYRLIG